MIVSEFVEFCKEKYCNVHLESRDKGAYCWIPFWAMDKFYDYFNGEFNEPVPVHLVNCTICIDLTNLFDEEEIKEILKGTGAK